MFNGQKPSLDQLPTSAQLLRSTLLAAIAAVIILVAVVMPAEYGIDPTGAGRILGLTDMGEIKQELADEALNDHDSANTLELPGVLLDAMMGLFVGSAYAQSAKDWKDEITFTLNPGETRELKLVMNDGDIAQYAMVVTGGRVNYDLHAHGGGQSITYDKGRGSQGAEGEIVAAFTGDHGWFWRNRDKTPLTVTIRIRGEYSDVKRDG